MNNCSAIVSALCAQRRQHILVYEAIESHVPLKYILIARTIKIIYAYGTAMISVKSIDIGDLDC